MKDDKKPRADVLEMADKIQSMGREDLIRLVAMFIGEYNTASQERDSLREALAALLNDTQHTAHNCIDLWCPVENARKVLGVK